MSKEHVSLLAQRIAERPRKIHEFDISGFFGLAGKEIPKIGIRVPTKAEQDAAIVAAHVSATNATKSVETAKADDDIIRDLKSLHILHKCCLDTTPSAKPTGEKFHYPAFPSPGWMADHLTTEQIGVLLNLVNEVRRIEGPGPKELDDATVEAFHGAAASADCDLAADFLAGCDREFLCQLYILEAHALKDARRQIQDLEAEVETLKSSATTEPQSAVES